GRSHRRRRRGLFRPNPISPERATDAPSRMLSRSRRWANEQYRQPPVRLPDTRAGTRAHEGRRRRIGGDEPAARGQPGADPGAEDGGGVAAEDDPPPPEIPASTYSPTRSARRVNSVGITYFVAGLLPSLVSASRYWMVIVFSSTWCAAP